MQSDAADMWNIGYGVQQFGKRMVRKQQWITATEYHLVYGRMTPNIIQRLGQLSAVDTVVMVREMASKTVTTIDRAGTGENQEYPTGVFVDQSRQW